MPRRATRSSARRSRLTGTSGETDTDGRRGSVAKRIFDEIDPRVRALLAELSVGPPSEGGSGREVGDVRASFGRASLWFLPLLLAAEGGQIEEVIGAAQHLSATRVHRVGMEDDITITEEHAVAGLLGRSLSEPTHVDLLELVERPVVPHHRGHRCVDGYVEVVIEIASQRRVPRKDPTLGLYVPLDLVQGSTGDHHEGRISGVEMVQEPR